MANAEKFEAAIFEDVVRELMQLYAISAPPIPIERVIQHPHEDMWEDVDVNDLSANFLNISTPYSPRMSMARFLARLIVKSKWGHERGLNGVEADEPSVYRFARIIAMPVDMVMEINPESRTPQLISLHFEVPESDAHLRLQELSTYSR